MATKLSAPPCGHHSWDEAIIFSAFQDFPQLRIEVSALIGHKACIHSNVTTPAEAYNTLSLVYLYIDFLKLEVIYVKLFHGMSLSGCRVGWNHFWELLVCLEV